LAEATRLGHQEYKPKKMLNHPRHKQNNNPMLNHPWKKLKQCLITVNKNLHQHKTSTNRRTQNLSSMRTFHKHFMNQQQPRLNHPWQKLKQCLTTMDKSLKSSKQA